MRISAIAQAIMRRDRCTRYKMCPLLTACLWCYTDTPVSPSIELAKYHNITEVEQPYFISILPLSIIFHSILEMFRPNSFFFHFILSLKKYYNFFTSEKNPKSDILSSNYNYNSESIWLLWQHQLLLLL
jgi:hypothetical protein